MTLLMRPGYGGAAVSDPDAQAYLQAVEVADNQALEQGVQQAVNQFVIGCKADGIWSAIKASCILAGARTLTGALIPLAGTAPTNVNFVSGDYNRKTGLAGDGSTKYLNSNRAANADPQNNCHLSVYRSSSEAHIDKTFIGSFNSTSGSYLDFRGSTFNVWRLVTSATAGINVSLPSTASGFFGASRTAAAAHTGRMNGTTLSGVDGSAVQGSGFNHLVFGRWNAVSSIVDNYSTARLAFYSIGESLDLAKLDTRVSALITAFGAAIP
jgi:hypothetical protein